MTVPKQPGQGRRAALRGMLLCLGAWGCAGNQAVPSPTSAATPPPAAAPPAAAPPPAAPRPRGHPGSNELTNEAGEAILMSVDADGDGLVNGLDNCPGVANPDQADLNGNGYGDVCEGPPVSVDLSAALSFSANPAHLHKKLTLRLSVSNLGETASGPVTAELLLPEEVRFLAVTSSGPWTCTPVPEEPRVTCTVGDIEPGATKTAVLRVKPSQVGTFTFWLQSESDTIDDDYENNEAAPVLTVAK